MSVEVDVSPFERITCTSDGIVVDEEWLIERPAEGPQILAGYLPRRYQDQALEPHKAACWRVRRKNGGAIYCNAPDDHLFRETLAEAFVETAYLIDEDEKPETVSTLRAGLAAYA